MDYTIKAIELIKEKHGPGKPKKFIKGFIKCPKCGGKLFYTISNYNGHIWGKCQTENCVGWMM